VAHRRAASVGRNAVSVRMRPIIGIFSTGNELVGVGSAAGMT
jgi:molybdopterin biosynthesis enzyme